MRPRFVCVLVAILLASVTSVQAIPTTWDAYTGFSSTSNTVSDLWQYMEVPGNQNSVTNAGYSLLATYGPFPYQSYNGWQVPGNFPAVGVSGGEIKMQPDGATTSVFAAVIGWKSPITGNVNVSFSVACRDLSGPNNSTWDGVGYNLFRQGDTTALATGYVANPANTSGATGTSGTISIPGISIASGTMLYLQVNDGVVNNWYDTAGVTFTVTQAVPEPSTVVILISGLIGLLAYAWRKRK